jgi:transcriptional regulator with XRE-family HTH domain
MPQGMTKEMLGNKLRVLRAERGLSLRQASKATGVDIHTLSSAEKGHHMPWDKTLSKLAVGYNIPVSELVGAPNVVPEQREDDPERKTVEISAAAGGRGGILGSTLVAGVREHLREDAQLLRDNGRKREAQIIEAALDELRREVAREIAGESMEDPSSRVHSQVP